MRKVLLIILCGLCLSCGSAAKLTENWKSHRFSTLNSKKIVVISKASNTKTRKSFEEEITSELQSKGVNAVASYAEFPSLSNYGEEVSDKEIEEILQLFREADVHGLLITGLKDKEEYTSDSKQNDTAKEKYSFTLEKSYKKSNAINENELVSAFTSTIYVLEAITYSINLKEKKRLVGVTLVEITNPDSLSQVRIDFSKLVTKAFTK